MDSANIGPVIFLVLLALSFAFLFWRETWPSTKERRAKEQAERDAENKKWDEERAERRRQEDIEERAHQAAKNRHHALSMKENLSEAESAQLTALSARLGYNKKVVIHRQAESRPPFGWGEF